MKPFPSHRLPIPEKCVLDVAWQKGTQQLLPGDCIPVPLAMVEHRGNGSQMTDSNAYIRQLSLDEGIRLDLNAAESLRFPCVSVFQKNAPAVAF
uniref:Uncharacterized protein n=1 Tax=Anguilla anguilla TaxID=7936 RepID=A0A0E9QKQ9_ANGAN